jgi:CRP-like cAMP-binding protein
VRYLRPGSIFGEVGLIAGSVRTATIISLNYCTCAMLSKENFEVLGDKFPEAISKIKDRMMRY